MRIATVNVNGIRAAARKGMGEWLAASAPDILLLQEVRADEQIAVDLLPGYEAAIWPCGTKCVSRSLSVLSLLMRDEGVSAP